MNEEIIIHDIAKTLLISTPTSPILPRARTFINKIRRLFFKQQMEDPFLLKKKNNLTPDKLVFITFWIERPMINRDGDGRCLINS